MSEDRRVEPYARHQDLSHSLSIVSGLRHIGSEEESQFDISMAEAGLELDELTSHAKPMVKLWEVRFAMLGGVEMVKAMLIAKDKLERTIKNTDVKNYKGDPREQMVIKIGDDPFTLADLNRVLKGIDKDFFEDFYFVKQMTTHEPKRVAASTSNMRDVVHAVDRYSMNTQSTITI